MNELSPFAAFVEKAYEDANVLLVELRDYVAGLAETKDDMPPAVRLKLTTELSQVTRLLTEVVAWLLVQKAVAAGEITVEEAAGSEAAALPEDVSATAENRDLGDLPLVARGLIDRTRRLYRQVLQLDASRKEGDSESG
jgi:regulator of CtrA degradation